MQNLTKLAILALLSTVAGQANATGQTGNMKVGITIGGAKHSNPKAQRYTCNAAKAKVRMAGFDKIEALSCTGNHYEFQSASNGTHLLIRINSQTGTILDVRPN